MMKAMHLDGLVLVDKPQHLTSNATLQRVKRLFGAKKAGHTGSLDPLATGMLPICLGEATKLSQFLLDADKCYLVTGKLGVITDSGDALGQVLHEVNGFNISEAQVRDAVSIFKGSIKQIPPMFSALKHQGKPLYHLARQGIEIERMPREITIYHSELLSFNGSEFMLRVTCSKGTYIRSLVMDIGEHLGVGAHVTVLHRCYTAGFAEETMWSLERLTEKTEEQRMACILPMDRAVASLPEAYLSREEAVFLHQGQVLTKALDADFNGCVRLYQQPQSFIGIGEYHHLTQTLKAKRLLAKI